MEIIIGRIMMNSEDITIIICCAGMGTRLGIGSTKALIDVGGKSLITRQLELIKEYDDVRIVVGYQAGRVIDAVNKIRKDVMYAFNYDYRSTGEAESLSKALVGLRKYTVIIDGDILVNAEDFKTFMEYPGECLGVCKINSDEPIYAVVDENMDVIGLNEESGTHEFSCVSKLLSERLKPGKRAVYELLRPLLPVKSVSVRARDIDTPDDYDRMIKWYETECI